MNSGQRPISSVRAPLDAATSVSGMPHAALPAWCYSLLGGLLWWLSFPPVGWSLLAWIAPVPWLLLVRRSWTTTPRRFYGQVWLGNGIAWLAMLQGIRLAHPANYLGWLVLASYAAAYLPLFVVVLRLGSRVVPWWLTAPWVWVGAEYLRSHLFTGFAIALLGHSQYRLLPVIQVADLTGAYGVSWILVAVAASLVACWEAVTWSSRRLPLAYGMAVILATLGYGEFRVRGVDSGVTPPMAPLDVALLQGTRDKVFEFNPEAESAAFQQYRRLTHQARDEHPELDLVVWPESAFAGNEPDVVLDEKSLAENDNARKWQQLFSDKVLRLTAEANRVWSNGQFETRRVPLTLLVGSQTVEVGSAGLRLRNSALLLSPEGGVAQRYYKMHPVMFGEYVPWGETFPWLYSLTPMRSGLTPGDEPHAFPVQGWSLSPSVCFETTVPHLIRSHAIELQRTTGRYPDAFVSVTDDGWFWGSSILDLHLACAVFRAVELRRWFLVAANTGITAAIDGNGRVRQQLPRRQEGLLVLQLTPDARESAYLRFGDWWAVSCVLVGALCCAGPTLQRRCARAAIPR